jgi:hypothetical protein
MTSKALWTVSSAAKSVEAFSTSREGRDSPRSRIASRSSPWPRPREGRDTRGCAGWRTRIGGGATTLSGCRLGGPRDSFRANHLRGGIVVQPPVDGVRAQGKRIHQSTDRAQMIRTQLEKLPNGHSLAGVEKYPRHSFQNLLIGRSGIPGEPGKRCRCTHPRRGGSAGEQPESLGNCFSLKVAQEGESIRVWSGGRPAPIAKCAPGRHGSIYAIPRPPLQATKKLGRDTQWICDGAADSWPQGAKASAS